jgi:AcrR family transcriptional regulator
MARLSPDAWTAAALEVMADKGLAGVAVEPLASKLGVTKGSFYWHFHNREDLLAATLERWEKSYTDDLIDRLARIADPRDRLRRLIRRVSQGGRGDRVHMALASADHPLVRSALARVTERRLDFLERCYGELGQVGAEARRSALLAYAAYVGLVHLRSEAPKALPSRTAFQEYVARLAKQLVP